MSLDYRIAPLPAVWPGKATPAWARKPAPFKTIETKALALLAREIRQLGGKNIEIAVDVEPRFIRQDGHLYANARPTSPAVVVSFDVKDGRLAFPCDTFGFFWANVDAIARALEALRMVDRYGVQQGRQYTGFKALPSSSSTTLTAEQAARVIVRNMSGYSPERADEVVRLVVAKKDEARQAVRFAQANTHPDRPAGRGNVEEFQRVQTAKKVLEAHHGGAL